MSKYLHEALWALSDHEWGFFSQPPLWFYFAAAWKPQSILRLICGHHVKAWYKLNETTPFGDESSVIALSDSPGLWKSQILGWSGGKKKKHTNKEMKTSETSSFVKVVKIRVWTDEAVRFDGRDIECHHKWLQIWQTAALEFHVNWWTWIQRGLY